MKLNEISNHKNNQVDPRGSEAAAKIYNEPIYKENQNRLPIKNY